MGVFCELYGMWRAVLLYQRSTPIITGAAAVNAMIKELIGAKIIHHDLNNFYLDSVKLMGSLEVLLMKFVIIIL